VPVPRGARPFRARDRFDRRGKGLSDPVSSQPTLEEQAEDLADVVDAVGVQRAALLGDGDGGRTCALFAATRRERVSALVLYGTSASGAEVVTPERRQEILAVIEQQGRGWPDPVWAPSMVGDEAFAQWWRRFEACGDDSARRTRDPRHARSERPLE
jgi:pimeloyl-ACP methyl ester carboxylesterase